jgi:signal transduction histidine kinase/CheY-like chemotaxis protein
MAALSSPVWFLAAIAAAAGIALVLLLLQRGRVLRQAATLAQDVETLNDRLWALADSEERYRSLIEAQGDLIVRRHDGRIVYANAAYAALVGLTEESVTGSLAEPARLACRPAETLADGARVFDECLATPAGERWISWVETAVPVAIGRTVLQRVGRDITLRIAGEQALVAERALAESASEAKSRFLATVSHEFRTPLNGILGMSDLLCDTALDAEQATYVGALRSSGEAMLALVDDLLDVAKVEAGKLELDEAPFELAALAETVTELMATRAQAKGLEIASFIAPDLPERLIGDRNRLRQILLNLVGNAVKFTEAGGVGIRIVRADDTLAIEVADTGPGIPADRLGAIFEEFEQADTSPARRHEGTGLGLAIVRRLVELMQGTVAVESEPGRGATFRIALPLRPASETPVAAPPDWRGRHLVLVSAAAFGARFLAETLRASGARVSVCTTPEAGHERLAAGAGREDALLVDLAIGAEPARILALAAEQAGWSERIILLEPGERRDFGPPRAAGFSGFLIKPVRARSLYQRLSDRRETIDPPQNTGRSGPSIRPDALAEPLAARLTVLVAEDNEINALLARRTLERLGCTPVWARNGREALELAQASLSGGAARFDLALLDIRMPELDGLSAARAIRALEETAGGHLPLIAVTANVSPADRSAALAAGMDDCLAKPLERAALADIIGRLETTRAMPLRA